MVDRSGSTTLLTHDHSFDGYWWLTAAMCKPVLGGDVRFAFGNLELSVEELVAVNFPPRKAWANVVHWCSTVLPFSDAAEVEAWCERHRLPRGELVPWSRVLQLGRVWYGRHLDEDFRKWSASEAQRIFDEVGLTGDFWRVPQSDAPF